ncbi:MAG: hypothetical protein AAF067_12100 [Pseudomonadota bacterium]
MDRETGAEQQRTDAEGQNVLREPRLRRLVKIEIIRDGRAPADGFVRNLSSFGLCARSAEIPIAGETISVRKEGFGELRATVRWTSDTEFGVQFAERINVDHFNFGAQNKDGHFVQQIDNGHVWTGFQHEVSTRRPGLRSR